MSAFELGTVGLEFNWRRNSVKIFHKSHGKECSSAQRASGLFLTRPLAGSGRRGRASLPVVPHSDDSERGKYFYNPGVVSGIRSLGKKCSYLPHTSSLLAEMRISQPAGQRGRTVLLRGAALRERAAGSGGLWSVHAARGRCRVSAGPVCSVVVPRPLLPQKQNSSVVAAPWRRRRQKTAGAACRAEPPAPGLREGAGVVRGAGVQDPSGARGPLPGLRPGSWGRPDAAGRRTWRAGRRVAVGRVAEGSCGQEGIRGKGERGNGAVQEQAGPR